MDHNEEDALYDVTPQLNDLANLLNSGLHTGRERVSLQVQEALNTVLSVLSHSPSTSFAGEPLHLQQPISPSRVRPVTPELHAQLQPSVRLNVRITRKTVLDKLYTYDSSNAVFEYPETSKTGSVGHLLPFVISGATWINPIRNIVYSQGEPRGTTGDRFRTCTVLVDDEGKPVPCRVMHSTCQGVKRCPYTDLGALKQPHIKATREALVRRLREEMCVRQSTSSLKQLLFKKTFSYYTALREQGCLAPPHEATYYSGLEADARERHLQSQEKRQRGHPSPNAKCSGRLVFAYNRAGRAFVHCEHYNRRQNIDHFITYDISSGLYDLRYLEALFFEDHDTIEEFEEEAAELYCAGPLARCTTVANISSVKVNCLSGHRANNGELEIPELVQLKCLSNYRIYEPIEEYRHVCPHVLIVCHGEHTHPIPIPSKTPPSLREDICKLLEALQHDLPDLTPRRFMRHPAMHAFLRQKLPEVVNPTLSDLHPSLANRDHIRAFILKSRENMYPAGTGWEGVIYLKEQQDIQFPGNPYIRSVSEITDPNPNAEDEDDNDDVATPFRMVVCMTKESSARLLRAQYLQSDIGFKRIVGFKEFELGGLEPDSRTTVVYCRIYLNKQTAEAHRLVFKTIEEIVLLDTGQSLRWRHLHSMGGNETDGIVQFTVDQHGGQAKGLGLHLKSLAQKLPGKFDLHESHRQLKDLNEYEHLRRLLRLCTAHVLRNIRKCAVSEPVRNKMRSLICMQHPNWDETLRFIEVEGSKAGSDWIADKLRSRFAFPAICWEKSFIPKVVWQVGDTTSNIIESVHADVNREGVACTLVGGLKKGQYYDNMKEKTLHTWEITGIRPSYQRGHIFESTARSLKRKGNAQHQVMVAKDDSIEVHNKRLKKSHNSKIIANKNLQSIQAQHGDATVVEKALLAKNKADTAYARATAASLQMVGSGSGKVPLLLPSDIVSQRLSSNSRGSM